MPRNAIFHDRQSQIEIGRRLDEVDIAAQIQIDDFRLEARLVRAVDEIEAIRNIGQTLLQAIDRLLDPMRRRPAAPKKTKHAGPAHCLDDFAGADAVGHGAGEIRISQAMIGEKGRVTQLLGANRGAKGDDGNRIVIMRVAAELN